MSNNANDKAAQLSRELFEQYRAAHSDYRAKQKKWLSFALGDQWEESVKEILESRGQAPLTFNYIISAVENAVASLTAKTPGFSVVGRDDSDVRKSRAFANFLSYLLYVSDGDVHFKQAIWESYVKAVGYIYVYEDPNEDYGRGELKMTTYENVWVDPNSKSRFFDDAAHIILGNDITEEDFKNTYPQFAHVIDSIPENETDDVYAANGNVTDDNNESIDHPGDLSNAGHRKFLMLERLTKVSKPHYRVLDKTTQEVVILNESEKKKFDAMACFVIVTDSESILTLNKDEFTPILMNLDGMGVPYQVQETTIGDAFDLRYEIAPFYLPRIELVCSVNDKFLYKRELPVSRYPLIPFMQKHIGTPHPLCDVGLAYHVQEFVNKMVSLVVAHTQASTTIKLFLPKGSVADIEKVEEDWNRPNSVIEYDASYGEPHTPTPPPLSNSVLNLIMMGKSMIEYIFGIFEMQMGNGQQAPDTYKGTMAVNEFGQQRIKSKLQDVERSIRRVGQVMLEWSQSYYTIEKFFKVIQPNGEVIEGEINKVLTDEYGNEIQKMNDITQGRYDLVVVAGSTLPSNRWAEWETYKEAYSIGAIDRQELLKKSEIFDAEGVLKRISEIENLNAQLGQAQQQIKELQGDLQTATRESTSDRKRVELEKFKTQLNKIIANLEKDEAVNNSMVETEVKKVLMELRSTAKPTPQDNPGERQKAARDSAKKGKK